MIGRLGIPLGTAVEVEAVVRVGDPDGSKARAWKIYLDVEKVTGKALPEAVDLDFEPNPGACGHGLVSDHFALAELLHGTRPKRLNGHQVAALVERKPGALRDEAVAIFARKSSRLIANPQKRG